jgi:acyl-CoA thioesterase I
MMRHFKAMAGSLRQTGALMGAAALAAVLLPVAWEEAHAQAVTIVALGASNTAGTGVGKSAAWPARLQAMLKARGVNATVLNAGVHGDTTGGMLGRLDRAVPPGARVVILQPGGNDARRGQAGQTAGNIAQIQSRLAARKVAVVVMGNSYLQAVPSSERQADRIHFTPEGHARLAAAILPETLAALGR